MYSEDELLPLSGLQHLLYCERQWALIHVEQSWEDNAETIRGSFFHDCVDTPGYSCARDVRTERRVHLKSSLLGLYGVADIVEYCQSDDGVRIMPVEYKVGKPKIEDWDRIQVAAQALCLEEMEGVVVSSGSLFYGETRRREEVPLTKELRAKVVSLSVRIHELFDGRSSPRPSRGPKCRRCSLADACMPEIDGLDAARYWSAEESELSRRDAP